MKKSRNIYTIVPVGLLCVITGVLIGRHMSSDPHPAADGCAASAVVDTCCPVDESRSAAEESEHEGHAHQAIQAEDLDTLAQTACEHAVALADCDECRYEAGLVKLEPQVADALIATGVVQRQDRRTAILLTGQVQLDSTRTVAVVSAGGGRVETIFKRLGDTVAEGDVLAVIHSPQLGQVKADFLETQAALELAEATFKREQSLLDKQITSQADYLEAANKLKAVEAALAAVDKRLRLFGLTAGQIAAIKDEKQNGDFAQWKLLAPQAGTVIAQNLSVGKMAAEDETLFTISDLSNLWVWCDVYENQLAALHERLQKGPLEAAVRVNAFGETLFAGALDFMENVMDEQARTVKARIQMKNPQNKLRPGMFAEAEILFPQPGSIVAVPSSAVMSDDGRDFVFRHWKENLWVRADVAIGQKYGELVEITGGVAEGQTIVTSGAFMLKSDILREKMGAGCAD